MSRRIVGPLSSTVVGVLLLVAPLWALLTPGAQADVNQLFVGFSFEGTADGYQVTGGDPKAAGHPQGAGRVAHTFARLNTGPAAYALASHAWPGGLLGNLGSLMQGAGGAPEETDAFNYPVRAEAQSSGPQESELRDMRAVAKGELAHAEAESGPSGEGAFTAGSVHTESLSTVEGDFGVSRANAIISDINVGAGTFTADSVITTAQARTNSQTGSNSGGARVNGARVGGHPVIIDENGVRVSDSQNPNPAQAATQAIVDNILSHAQMKIFMTQPQRRSDGGTQEYRSGSLVVQWIASEGDPSVEDGAVFTVAFGGAGAFVQANPAIPFVPPPPLEDFFVPSSPDVAGDDFTPSSGEVTSAEPTTPPPTGEVALGADPRIIPTEPIVDRFDGIGWLLILLALVGAGLSGRGLLRLQSAVAGRPAAACTLHGDRP